jgi:hypothetical protein
VHRTVSDIDQLLGVAEDVADEQAGVQDAVM